MQNKTLVFWLCLLTACIPSLLDHVLRMWRLEQYHYLPALFLAVILLVWQRWDGRLAWPSHWAWGFLLSGGVALLLAFLSGSSWVGSLAFLLFLGGWLMTHREHEYDQSLLALWPPCWLLLPIPLGLDASLTSWLQLWSSRLSSFSLDFLRVPHALFGNVLELPTGKMFVEEACSGVQSLFTVIFVAVLLVSFFRRSVWLLPLYVIAAIFWAGIMNVVRIVAIAYVQDRFSIDLAHGWPHAMLGYACLGLAVLFLLSTDRLFRVFSFPIEPNAARQAETNPFVFAWNRIMWQPEQIDGNVATEKTLVETSVAPTLLRSAMVYGLAGFALLLAAGQTWRMLPAASAQNASRVVSQEPFLVTSPDLLTGLDGFRITAHEVTDGQIGQPFGQHADVWRGEYKGLAATVALSQPYPGWHDLCVCYTGVGLKMNDRRVLPGAVSSGGSGQSNSETESIDWNYVSARLVGDDGRVTYLWFSAFDRLGNPVFAPDSGVLTRWISRLQAGDSLLGGPVEDSEVGIVQLVVESAEFLPAERVADLEQFHLSSRAFLCERTTGNAEGGSE